MVLGASLKEAAHILTATAEVVEESGSGARNIGLEVWRMLACREPISLLQVVAPVESEQLAGMRQKMEEPMQKLVEPEIDIEADDVVQRRSRGCHRPHRGDAPRLARIMRASQETQPSDARHTNVL